MQEAHIVDVERWPLVYIKPPSMPQVDGAALSAYYAALGAMLARRRPYVALMDMRGLRVSPDTRRSMLEWLIQHDAAVRQLMIALALLANGGSDTHVTTTFWDFDHSYHARIFVDRAEAEHWLLSEYARHEATNHV